jgi:hypothetical protein
MDDERKLFDRLMEATEGAIANVTSAAQRAQQSAVQQLPFATADDVARLQATLDRIEAGLNDVNRRLVNLEGRQSGPVRPDDPSPGTAL